MKCIYQPGKEYLETASKSNPPRNLDGETFDEMLTRLNSNLKEGETPYEIMDIDQASEQIGAINHAKYCGPWQEITEEKWWDALEVLPPEKWQTVAGVEIFRMMEYTTGDITSHYARIGDRYFSRNLPISTKYRDIAAEVSALA